MVQQGTLRRWAARIDLDGLLKRPYCAFFFSRDEMYLCPNDHRAGLKKVFRPDQLGFRLHRGVPPAGEPDVRILHMLT
jgi:hypothetical protein